ncbi:hypothetical protein [Sulfolobus acidocaldarius]|uniref:CRISPR-associated protein Cas6 C-terminal domain-containing protein n=3 Tax=Sulfolobus acidocaldarius TaxID=2285 RepID=Q4J784_SULAC|nr:hypothetical protein [Sulfolobus acidocaldarius]AAY81347.1 hypothetical protein Saci_2053 [Sulfolobus acidocaldarius DSM 639]AGE74261.1 hypothetical protein SacRon12I_10225 [Sulfolobus acidocaldarius Ron12/I]ALU29854.1 hypothetical protein ATY89_07815 [Sulfolobus acidocaldarius]ALU32593.1 hypothetical protein ATZ20_10835 [Sulfolobus acidocaldarius]WCM35849.1 hypothetical protein GO597_11175 [Sulfolobus acidocaldarius DSM 639]
MLSEILDRVLWAEPSTIYYKKVVYDGKEILGLLGKFSYTVLENSQLIYEILEDVIAMGVGSSRRNGFGRVKFIMYNNQESENNTLSSPSKN